MRHVRSGQPIWLRRSSLPQQRYPALVAPHHTDVAIVGGGMTGALVAHAFAEANVPVILIDAARVGRGSTAASSALLLQEPDLGLRELRERYGTVASRRLWRLSQKAVRELIALLQRLDIRCDLLQRDVIYYAIRGEGSEKLRREFELRTRDGFHGRWLSPGQLRRMTGIPGRGAILTHGSAQFDPYRACVGLLRSASDSGAQIFERTAVRRIEPQHGRVRLHTRHGVIDIGPHRRYPGQWFALGYGGNGMTFGLLAARLLLERWQGVMSADHRLFGFDRAEHS